MQNLEIFERALKSSRELLRVPTEKINSVLLALAQKTTGSKELILEANSKDLALKDPSDPMYDRLKLTGERIDGIVSDMLNVVKLDFPQGKTLESFTRPNGMEISKVSVPFGVIGVIYEARPNVSFDVFSLCFKSSNACLLKGGSDAHHSNSAIVGLIRETLREEGLSEDIVQLLPADRAATSEMLSAVGYVDVIIPRGSSSLINFVRDNSRVPVIETGAGICHVYYDKAADKAKGSAIINNSKTRRVSVCNALDCLVIHSDRVGDLAELAAPLALCNVKVYADEPSYSTLSGHYPTELLLEATPESYGTEFLGYTMSIKTVDSLTEAIDHITEYSSKHSEAIVSEDSEAIRAFNLSVDAACVYNNLPTSFTDGAEFGFGAEIGISTQKLHARGPMALRELTTYKYIISGKGQVRK